MSRFLLGDGLVMRGEGTIRDVVDRKIYVDLDQLIRTRLLIQANSGGGKSWIIRRICEQSFDKIQIMLIDREGEFATLREKYGFVLVGEGGDQNVDAPADPRLAAQIAVKMLELRASCICDVASLKPDQKPLFVKNFLRGLLDANKKLWHPVLVIVDEAHYFCPERGAGESIATEEMIDFASSARKRGFVPIYATQRLQKLHKDAAGELHNVLIGKTWLDVDRKRAADTLGVQQKHKFDFYEEIKRLKAGEFIGLGPAISEEQVWIKSGPVETTHPDAGMRTLKTIATPRPDAIKKFLPSLADLPREAEEKARTLDDYKRQIAELKKELRASKAAAPAKSSWDEARAQKIVNAALEQERRHWGRELKKALASIAGIKDAAERSLAAIEKIAPPVPDGKREAMPVVHNFVKKSPPVRPADWNESHANGDATAIGSAHQKILDALAEFEAIGRDHVARSTLASWCGVSSRSAGFEKNLGRLRVLGYIQYPNSGRVALTDVGRTQAMPSSEPLSTDEMFSRIKRAVSTPRGSLLDALRENHPTAMAREDLATAAGVSPTSAGFEKNLGALRVAEMIEYPAAGFVKLSDWMFIE